MQLFSIKITGTMKSKISPAGTPLAELEQGVLALQVLKQFRLIYGTVRQHFREVEQHCGVTGSQLWLLHETANKPGLGVSELARKLSIHQSTCSLLVDKLVSRGLIIKRRSEEDQRRVGLYLSTEACDAIAMAPGPAEGVLPEALQALDQTTLEALYTHLGALICRLPTRDERSADKPLSEL
ncbi:MarR family winged helix-turn-helix transcriptional regulator [Zoogloea sp.]|uniref:MarR family winged helix-turn-helix transcriptional regulator n=1 Tax=Zoogloea sp. TaxID=49181 RepID=UPI0035AE66CF|nr:MarR family transcriptional regulator [Rhodocyclales bacterium]